MPRKNLVSFQKKKVKWDIHGFADATKHQPLEIFELCLLVDDKGRRFQGWWNGYLWEGIRLKKENKILKWRFVTTQEKDIDP